MKNFSILLSILILSACAPQVERLESVQGPPGATGSPGADGSKGPKGDTGAAGSNGHSLVSEVVAASELECDEAGGQRLDIYLDLDDSLTVSEGDAFQSSLVACNGKNGLNGATGMTGATGATGAAGATGPQGAPGPAGSVGPQGAQGVAGPVGPMGPQGPQGAIGAQGPAGSGATIQNFTLSTSSCMSIGDSLYAKKSGSTDVKVYTSSSCSGSSLVETIADQESNWLTSIRLGFSVGGNLRVIKYN